MYCGVPEKETGCIAGVRSEDLGDEAPMMTRSVSLDRDAGLAEVLVLRHGQHCGLADVSLVGGSLTTQGCTILSCRHDDGSSGINHGI